MKEIFGKNYLSLNPIILIYILSYGNHDQIYQNQGEFKGSYLYKAFITGIINHLSELIIDNVYIRGIDYANDFIPISEPYKYSICVAHSFYENERFGGIGNGNLTDSKCIELKYNAYVLGHDHVPYEQVIKPTYTIVRPGSLTRATSKTCNIYRKVQVAVFDTDILQWSYIEVPIIPGTEAFNEKVIIQKSEDLNLEKILSNLEFSSSDNLFDFLESDKNKAKEVLGDSYDDVIKLITRYCESFGIYRNLES